MKLQYLCIYERYIVYIYIVYPYTVCEMYMHTHNYVLQCVVIGIKPGVLSLLG